MTILVVSSASFFLLSDFFVPLVAFSTGFFSCYSFLFFIFSNIILTNDHMITIPIKIISIKAIISSLLLVNITYSWDITQPTLKNMLIWLKIKPKLCIFSLYGQKTKRSTTFRNKAAEKTYIALEVIIFDKHKWLMIERMNIFVKYKGI